MPEEAPGVPAAQNRIFLQGPSPRSRGASREHRVGLMGGRPLRKNQGWGAGEERTVCRPPSRSSGHGRLSATCRDSSSTSPSSPAAPWHQGCQLIGSDHPVHKCNWWAQTLFTAPLHITYLAPPKQKFQPRALIQALVCGNVLVSAAMKLSPAPLFSASKA